MFCHSLSIDHPTSTVFTSRYRRQHRWQSGLARSSRFMGEFGPSIFHSLHARGFDVSSDGGQDFLDKRFADACVRPRILAACRCDNRYDPMYVPEKPPGCPSYPHIHVIDSGAYGVSSSVVPGFDNGCGSRYEHRDGVGRGVRGIILIAVALHHGMGLQKVRRCSILFGKRLREHLVVVIRWGIPTIMYAGFVIYS